jgi:hypothetical protein
MAPLKRTGRWEVKIKTFDRTETVTVTAPSSSLALVRAVLYARHDANKMAKKKAWA